jgi:hypothetical protein
MLDATPITAHPTAARADIERELQALLEMQRDAVREAQEAASARVQSLGSALQKMADERVSLRSEIEQRWLKAIRQINGIYESEEFRPDPDAYGSKVYVPLTRRLRNMAEARLCDMLFPSDDRSWVLSPSPVAELGEVAAAIKAEKPDQPVPGMPSGVTMGSIQKAVQEVQKEAEMRAKRMQRQVDDRLAEAKWPSKARQAISDAIDLGTGVVKGPVARRQQRREWRIDPNTGRASVAVTDKIVPTVEYVDLWNFYPDMAATCMEDAADVLEAHPMLRRDLQALRMQPGFNAAAIDLILKGSPRPDNQTRRQDLREIAGLSSAKDERYIVWEFHGTIRGADLNACAHAERGPTPMAYQDGEEVDASEEYEDDEDYPAVVWFCDGHVIKAIVRPLDTEQKHIYSVMWWQKDKASIFGYGLPDEVRDQQASSNGAFRAMLDNMGLTVGPQIVFDDEVIKPVDGQWNISPFKMWRKVSPSADVRAAFAFFQVDSRIAELSSVFDRSKALMDEIATMPAFGAGGEQPAYTQSATGASIAYQTATMWVRRLVRNWDDNIITPLMGRMVEWEMEFNPDDSMKGDYNPIARGVTALVELEGQGQRMAQFLQLAQSMGVPPRDQMRMLRKMASSLKLDPDEVLPTEEEIENIPPPGPDPETERVRIMDENAKRVHEAKMAALEMKAAELEGRQDELARREKLALMELATRERITTEEAARKYGYNLAKLNAEMADNEALRRHQAQLQNSEIAIKAQTGSGL